MNHNGIKFILKFEGYDESSLGDVFNRAKNILNWQFDEKYNAQLIDGDIDYQIMDVSDLKRNEIEKIVKAFFNFTFDNVIDEKLYRFLVLKKNKNIKVLTNICSLIFDYASLNDFYELFNDSSKTFPEYDLDLYYSDIKNYYNSSDFEKDSSYWKMHISNSGDYIKFYNLNDDNYKSQLIKVNESSVISFIKNHGCSIFDFYGSVFSLYLSFIDRLDGCLLKTEVSLKKNDLNLFNQNTILKIDVNKNNSFNDLLNEFNSSFRNAMNHTEVDVDNYLDENVSYYSVHDFSDLNKNIDIYNGENSALTLNIYENNLELVYNSNLFSDVYVEHMVKNIENLIDEILNYPEKEISDINMLSDEEKSLLDEFCKGKTVQVKDDGVLCEVFRNNAANHPEAIAVDDGVNQVSYGELEKSSNSIAYDLKENYGITPKSRVALILRRNYHFAEIVLALNKIGALFIPVDPMYPVKRVEHMLNIADADCIITTEELKSLNNFKIDVLFIEDLNVDNDVDFSITCKPDDMFSIMFTSGTTGLPKGVTVNNKQVGGLTFLFKNIFDFSYEDVCGCYLSFSFIASCLIYATLYLGGCNRIFNESEQKDSLSLVKTLKEKPMNNIILPPSIGIPIYENEDLKLDYLVLAGAKLNELSEKDSNTQIVNFYGTTEIAFAITKFYDSKDIDDGNVAIGRPVANTWAYILDDNNRQMPIGVAGEICISSKYISKGYINSPELTRKSFVENPYATCEDNRIMYRTGDIAFYNFEGEIEIIGREDDQLSVRGFRIEKEEILNIIGNFEEIANVYIDVEHDNLIAYYEANDEFNIENVKEALKEELPYYMVPSLFIKLDKIPLNMNGKIDKTRLKSVVNNENIEITDEIIGGVVGAFKEVLNLDSVLIDDDFVGLGGNSLSAMKLQLLLKERFGVSLSSNELISLSTPKDISNHIKFNLNPYLAVDEDKYTFDELCPLSESQLNVYLDESVNNMGTAYNNSFKIDFRNDFSADEIKKSLDKLFEVFPILKARVVNEEGVLSFAFDAEPEISEGSREDINTFVKAFKSDEFLSRFLIVEEDTSIVLCADFHHLIFDGTSLNILLSNFISILNNENIDFVDKGILRQVSFEENIDSEYMDNALKFFDEMLINKDEAYELMPSVNDDNEESELNDTIDIDREYLNSFLQKHSITHNQFFTSIFAYTLSRFSGSDKVIFNIIEDGRNHLDLSESVGMFVKTVPVLMDCKNQDVSSFLEYSSNLINSAMIYDLYPFRILASEYGLNSNILFQYSHDLFSDVLEKKDFNYDIDELKHDLDADLSFYIFNNGMDRLTIRILYSSKYSKEFIEHFAESYKLILQEILKVDTLGDINYITSEDIELLDSLNHTENKLEYADVLDAFNENLSNNPHNKLVSYNDISYTYGEGAFIANRIAEKLIELGINQNECIGFLTERNEYYMFCVLAIMSFGGIYVPLDDKLPDERIKFMLNDTKSKVIIVSDETYRRVKDLSDDYTILNISQIINGDIATLSSLPVNYNVLACILYTSGTTGIPKGVRITRKSILNVSAFYVNEYNLSSEDIYALFSAIGFDVSNFIINAVLYSGACLSVIPDDVRMNMSEMNNYFIKQGVTHAFITTQVGKLFMERVNDISLNVMLVAGEKLGKVETPQNYELIDGFGPTEAFAFVSSINNKDKIHESSVGFLNYNSKAYVLDEELRQVPFGATGELCLAGHQVADGYLNRYEETENVFVKNPFDSEDYGILYHTGDMVRMLPDGSIGIIGRKDSQVKIRGNRVELSEIESAIRQFDYVDDITVQIIKHNDNNELVAYAVSELDADELEENIKEDIGSCKPGYMIPSFVIKLDSIPLTVNGKVDKKALPEINLDNLHDEYVAPTDDVERDIVEAFEKVFDQEKIGIHDDFICLGGDSLTAIRLLSYLDEYDISVGDILSLHTPYAIAKNIRSHSFDLDIYSLKSGCPLSESQLNVYLDILSNNKIDSYLIPLSMSIPKKYSLNNVYDALNAMFEVHPILEMCVSDEFEVPYLVKGEEPSIIFRDAATEDFLIEFLTKPMDLNKSLSRFLIVDNDTSYSLFAVFHHIIFDATSRSVFKEDMRSVLNGPYPEIESSFLKESAFNQQIKETDRYNEAKKFYDYMLVDSDETNDFLDVVGADGPGYCSSELKIDLNEFLSENNISENVLFTSVFAYTMSRFTGSNKVLFNIIENGRGKFNNFDSIGMYVNTLPVLIDCKNQDSSSFMHNVSDVVYSVMKYDYYPFRLLAKEYEVTSSILFQYMPYWTKTDDDSSNDLFAKSIEDMDDIIGDFNVNIIQTENAYNISIAYSDKFSSEYIKRFINSYKSILEEMIICSELSEISYISNSDLMLLDSYNKTEHDLIHEDILNAFNDNLRKYPNNKLILSDDNSYTYGEGAFIADKIARKLMDLGVEAQDCVSFLVERSELYMFCILGIMSMGGVYVPVDDKLPDERVKFIFEDTDSSVVIVSDETYRRAENLINDDVVLLNISDIFNDGIGSLSDLSVCYANLACILYTSGTTGIPKGVKITRKSVLNLSEFYIREYDLNNNDVYALFASIGFDVAIKSIFPTICAGASLTVIPDGIKLDMDAMNSYFIRNCVTHTEISTQVAKLFISQTDETSLKVLTTGGEKLGDVQIDVDYHFVDSYGPTEACVDVTSIDLEDKIDNSSIGFLLDNTRAYVLDNEFRRVPIGAVGELFLAGNQISEGYLNRDNEMEKAFLENPYDDNDDYSVMYRTGDMVRVLPDGSFGIVGRHDSQVKIRGNRVELSEIETVIREIEYVNDVTIQTIKHDANNVLVAYVVISDETTTDNLKDDISKYVGDRKPDYMVPSFVIKLDCIPLNINGKVDQRALPEVDLELLHEDYIAPRNEKEKEIVEAFEKAFDMKNISVHDDFIRLGGDSLTAIKLLHYIDSDSITMADILKLRTPEAIAENIDDFSFDLDIYSLEEGCPLNSAQINVLADVTIYNKSNAYHIQDFIKISKKYSLENILDALERLLEAHPILSMRLTKIYEENEENEISNFEMIRDSISIAKKFGIKDIMEIVKSYGIRNAKGLYNMLQTAMKLLKGEYPYLIKGEKPPVSLHKFDKDILIDFASESLDLYNHLSKFMIMESDDAYYLFFVIHHIIFDATSQIVFNRDFQTILDGGSVDLDDTFLKVSAFTHHIKNTDKFDEAGEFFGSMLADVNEAGILTEEIPSATGYSMSQYDLEIDENLLNSYLNNAEVSANVLFTGVFAYALSKFVKKDKVIFTMIENGRDRFNEDFIDMTSNVMPLLIDCKDQSINSFLENTSDIVYGAMKHSYYPILLLYQKYNFEVNILFQFIPDLLSYEIGDIEDIDSSEIINHVLNSYNDFLTELLVQVQKTGDNYSLLIINSNKYSPKMVEDFKDTYISMLLNIINADMSYNLSSILNNVFE